MVSILPASDAHGPRLQEIERLAGARFRDVGMDDVADDQPPSLATLADYAAAGRSWVAVDDSGGATVLGYVVVDLVDGNAHVEQVSVDPAHQGAGVGRALLDRVGRWAAEHGLPALTLTTFRDVPWNGPLYEHLGFQVLGQDEIGPELAALVDDEAAHGLDPKLRVCMRRELTSDQ